MNTERVTDLPLYPVWKNAAQEAVEEFNYGDVITHDWLFLHLEIDEPTEKITVEKHRELQFDLLRKVEGFKEVMLADHLRYLVNIRGVGYKIIEPPRQTKAAMLRLQKELKNSIRDAEAALTFVNEAMLTLDDSRENAESKAKLAWFRTIGTKKLTGPDSE
jgi:hypothetical protein